MKPLSAMGKFATVVIDPPWGMPPVNLAGRGNNYGRIIPYKSIGLGEIARLPVGELLADDAFLFCWTINRYLADAISLVELWGAKYSCTFTWVKPNGMQFPNCPMHNCEWCILGRKGSPRFLDQRMFKMANYWPASGHSKKPEEFYDLLRRVTPEPRLDVFGRRVIPGFHSWGDQAPEGPPPPNQYQDVLSLEV